MSGRHRTKLRAAEALRSAGLVDTVLRLRRRTPIVLRYHRVFPDDATPFYDLGIHRSIFEAQLDFLKRHCAVLPLADVVAGLFHGRSLPDHAVAITFDDGYRDNYSEAFPALRARSLPATLFVCAHSIEHAQPFWWDRLVDAICALPDGEREIQLGDTRRHVALDGLPSRRRLFDVLREEMKERPAAEAAEWLAALEALRAPSAVTRGPALLDWAQIREMSAGGFEVHSHGLDHAVLSRIPESEARRQIVESRALLEERLARPIRFFSYPNGKSADVTPAVLQMVQDAGYEAALSTIEGRPTSRSSPWFVERIGATAETCMNAEGRFSETLFAAELAGFFHALFLRRWRGRAIS